MVSDSAKYHKIELNTHRSGYCSACGVWCKRKGHFWATLEHFRRGGGLATEEEVRKGLERKARWWHQRPLFHRKCEPVEP